MKPPGRPFDIFIEEAPKISEANLDATVFHSSQAIKSSGTSFPTTDFFQRANLFDGLYTEELINSALAFFPVLKENLSSKFSDFNTSSLDFLEKLIALTSLSNQRGVHNQIAAFVSNKTGMRNHVRSKLLVPSKNAQMLKNSNFTCEGVFGDLPEAFLSKFTTLAGGTLICKPKYRGASTSAASYGQARGQKEVVPLTNNPLSEGKLLDNSEIFPLPS